MIHRRSRLVAVGLAAVALAVTACTDQAATTTAGDSTAEKPLVLAANYPLVYTAERLLQDTATVENLTPPGVDPHDVELTAQDILKVEQADVVLYFPGLQPAVDEAVEQKTTGTVIAVTDYVPVGELIEGNPHVWVSPKTMLPVVEGLTTALAASPPLAPVGATIRVNGEGLRGDLAAIDDVYQTQLTDCASTLVVTNHAAFTYLTNDYGFTEAALSGSTPEAEPSPARISEVVQQAQDAGVQAVYSESTVSSGAAGTVGEELGVPVRVLNPVEVAPDSGDYLTVLRSNGDSLSVGQGCASL